MRLHPSHLPVLLLPLVLDFSASAPRAAAASPPSEILILYDNTSTRAEARANWGFAALVTWRGQRVLFDSGAKPEVLLDNMKVLGVDPARIPQAVISHEHNDHINGVYKVFPFNPAMRVYFLAAFPDKAFQAAQAAGMRPERVTGPAKLGKGIYTTGPVDGTPPEQALVVETRRGLVVITGCSHPGVVKLVEAAERQRRAKSVHLLIGGFHMLKQQEAEITRNIERLRQLRVATVIPTHCTGDLPTRLFAKLYGDKAGTAGVGKRIPLE